MEYTDSKRALVNAHDGNSGIFLCFKMKDGKYITVETFPENYPHTTLCIWNDVAEMKRDITWHDWIMDGFTDDELKDQIIN